MNQAVKTFIGMLAVIVIVLVTVLAVFEKSPLEKALDKGDFYTAGDEFGKLVVNATKDPKTCYKLVTKMADFAEKNSHLFKTQEDLIKYYKDYLPTIKSACK